MKNRDKHVYKNYMKLHRNLQKNLTNRNNISKIYKPSFAKKRLYKQYLSNKNISVLDLGSGLGEFASICKFFKIKKYLGLDISDEQLKICRKYFKEYSFLNKEIISYLIRNNKKYDVIVMEHVFEHFELDDQIKIIKLIMNNLNPQGVFINTMINTEAYFKGGGFYGDITHKALHDKNSLNQVLKLAGLENGQIRHLSSIQGNNIFEHLIHKIFIFFFHYFVRLAGYDKRDIYSRHIITIIKK